MKVSEFIQRLVALRDVAGEDVEVTVPVPDSDNCYETALAELQWVIHEPLSEKWRSRPKNNTHQIVVMR